MPVEERLSGHSGCYCNKNELRIGGVDVLQSINQKALAGLQPHRARQV